MIRALALSLALVACSKATPPAPAPTAPAPVAPPVPQSTGPTGSQDLAGLGNLVPILKGEMAQRTPTAVPAEKLFAALDHAGMPVKQKKQVLARGVDAQFCALGKLDSDTGLIGVIVCEYGSDAAAAASREKLDANAKIANVAREVRGSTLVTVTNVAENRDRQRRVFEVLRTL